MTNKERILKISKELDLSHIGSNISCLPVLEEIYAKKKPQDIVILDNAHAHLAHLVVKEEWFSTAGHKIEEGEDRIDTENWSKRMIEKHGIHCDRKAGCDASGGSLGHGLGIGIGYALADKTRDVYVVVSEGSMMEGSSWEALRLIYDLKIKNLHIYTNFNGYTAVAKREDKSIPLYNMMTEFFPFHINGRFTENGEGYEGVAGHYKKVDE